MSNTNDLVLTAERYPYSSPVSVEVPALKCDQKSLLKYGTILTSWNRRERRIVANLIAHLNRNGYSVIGVYDGDEEVAVKDVRGAMEVAFGGDKAELIVRHSEADQTLGLKGACDHVIILVFNNGNDGLDVIENTAIHRGDAGRFTPVLEAFHPEVFA